MIVSSCAGRVPLPGSPGSCFFSYGVHDGDQVLRRDSTRESAVLGKYVGTSVDFCSFVLKVIREVYNETTTILPYPVLIIQILANFDIEFLPSESTSDSQRPFSKATVSRSLGQISRKRQQGIASGNIGESFPDAATEFCPSLGIGPSSVQPLVPSESFTKMLSLLRSINKN